MLFWDKHCVGANPSEEGKVDVEDEAEELPEVHENIVMCSSHIQKNTQNPNPIFKITISFTK